MKRQLYLGRYGRRLLRGLLGVLSGAGGGMGISRGGERGWLDVSERPKVVSCSQHVVREKGMGLLLDIENDACEFIFRSPYGQVFGQGEIGSLWMKVRGTY